MGHLHTKTMNRLQAALLEHDFVIQYKKGEIMPADYLSRLPSANPDTIAEITQCFDPFQPDLIDLQRADTDLQRMNYFRVNGKWQEEVSKSGHKTFSRCPQHRLDQIRRLQISQNCTLPTQKISQTGFMRGSQSPIRRPQCGSQNIHPDFLVVLLAQVVDGHP